MSEKAKGELIGLTAMGLGFAAILAIAFLLN